MSAVVLIVQMTFKPGMRDAYVERALLHRERVLANEPGCERFDVVIVDDADDKVALYEVYADEDAFDHHNGTEYLQQYRDDIMPMVAERSLIRCRLAND